MTNRIQDAFDSIKADKSLKESTKIYLNEKYKDRIHPKRRRQVLRFAVSFACVLFMIASGAAGYSWIQTPVSYVSIDVNPSIELALNRFDRVVSAAAYNPEGEEVLSGLSLKGKKYTEAIHEVVECEGMREYLSEPSEVVLTVAAAAEHETELDRGVRRCVGHMGRGCQNARADIGTLPQAHECGLSFGKYNAYLKLLAYDSTITADDCKEMSMAEIRELIRKYEEEKESENGNENDGNGYGSGGCSNGNHLRKRHRHGGGHE